jgi:hypothetical protein
MKDLYKDIDGWFNMEEQYLELLNACPTHGTIVELGTYKGRSTAFMAGQIKSQRRKVKFYTVDNFVGITPTSEALEVEVYKNLNGSLHTQFTSNIEPLKDKVTVIVSDTDKAAALFDDKTIDCIFFDAGHSYEAVKADLLAWLPKMKDNCIISGHDYNPSWPGVIKAVHEVLGKPHKVENFCWFFYNGK